MGGKSNCNDKSVRAARNAALFPFSSIQGWQRRGKLSLQHNPVVSLVRLSLFVPKWDILANAKSMDDVKRDGGTQIFTTMFQAHLPNSDKPPLFIDLLASQENGQLVIDAKLMDRFRNNFYLETMIGNYADNLKSLRGFKFDWNRSDGNYDHLFANQVFTRKLREYGIAHQAEEYNGTWDDSNWGVDGRFYTGVLPFFARYLVFDAGPQMIHQ